MSWNLAPFTVRPLRRTEIDPFSLLQRDLNRAFDNLWSASDVPGTALSSVKIDVKEDEKAFHVVGDLPGMTEKEVEVTFDEGILTLRGEKKIERDEKKDTWHVTERTCGSFIRQVSLPGKIDADKITASFAQGVLTITLPKMEEAQAKSKKIEIKST